MKILWLKSDFLHPTTRGGRIRTLEILRRLHRNHEIHYLAYEDPASPEGLANSAEYCTHAYAVPHRIPPHSSPVFVAQVAAGVFSRLPVAVGRYCSEAMRQRLRALLRERQFDRLICDFSVVACSIDDLRPWILFQHNVETAIWRRHEEQARDPLRRWYFGLQARRMLAHERRVCRAVAHTIAVSDADACQMRQMFGVENVTAVPTGVDLEAFTPRERVEPGRDLVFVGAMDWLPNIDGVRYFVREILPRIRAQRPSCSLVIAGRTPSREILSLAESDPGITVTGTVPDVRHYFWDARVSIVPLRIGGGTRLKIYESMAARVPVVSTSIGAEGLDVQHPDNIRLADTPEDFARHCLDLLSDSGRRRRIASAAWDLVASRFSWDRAARQFEEILARLPSAGNSAAGSAT